MRILVFGASGKVGRLVVAEALRRGYEVSAFVHTEELDAIENLTNIPGDIYDRASVEAAIPGHDVIISTLGSWGTKDKNVLSTAMKKIVPIADTAGVLRLVSLTGSASTAPGDKASIVNKLSRVFLNAVAPKVLRDGEDHIRILADSNLNWSVIRAGMMTSNGRISYTLDRHSASVRISRYAVATAMVDLAETNEWPKGAPFIRQS